MQALGGLVPFPRLIGGLRDRERRQIAPLAFGEGHRAPGAEDERRDARGGSARAVEARELEDATPDVRGGFAMFTSTWGSVRRGGATSSRRSAYITQPPSTQSTCPVM